MAGEDPELLAALELTRAELERVRGAREQLLEERALRIAAEASLSVVRSELDAARAREENLVAAIQRARKDRPTPEVPVGALPGVHFGGAAERGGRPSGARRGKLAWRVVVVAAIGVAATSRQPPGVQVGLLVLGLLVATWVLRKAER